MDEKMLLVLTIKHYKKNPNYTIMEIFNLSALNWSSPRSNKDRQSFYFNFILFLVCLKYAKYWLFFSIIRVKIGVSWIQEDETSDFVKFNKLSKLIFKEVFFVATYCFQPTSNFCLKQIVLEKESCFLFRKILLSC